MLPFPFLVRLCAFAFLAYCITNLAWAETPPFKSNEEQIKALEKQISDLQSQLKQLKQGELLPAPREYFTGVLPESWINPMRWRSIGPAIMGGRITALAVVESESNNFWIATASGGLLHTVNNGVTFEHQFDREATVSLGAVAVAPSNKNIVWVGTGEANPRNSVSYGDGVYKSLDAGKTWKNMGLKQSFQIGKIVIHPKNPDIVYIAALGRLYGPNPERGLFKTIDGGQTWTKILFVNDKTGIVDVAMHPTDPETLIAASWERQRDEFDSFRGDAKKPEGTDDYAPAVGHGPGSGLYRTTNGGKDFTKLSKGLPTVKLGRAGLDFSRTHPDTLFAIIDTELSGGGNPPPPQKDVGYLGITGEDDTACAKLTAVTEGAPAEKAGLKAGDVVTHINAKPVKNYDALVAELRSKKPSEKIKLSILRTGEKKEFEIVLGFRTPPNKGGQDRPTLGIQVEPTTGGVLISEVLPKSPAEKAGLKVEDLITQIDGLAVKDRQVLGKALSNKKAGDKVKIVYLRGKESKEIEVLLEVFTPKPSRPNGDPMLGGQIANAQDWQGPEGFNTGGLFKSTDRGETWARVNSINARPFYFSMVAR